MKRPLKLVNLIAPVPWTNVTANVLRESEGTVVWDTEEDVVEAIPLSGQRKGQLVVIPMDNVASMMPLTDEEQAARREAEERKAEAAIRAASQRGLEAVARANEPDAAPRPPSDTIKLTAADVPGGRRAVPAEIAQDPVLDGLVDQLADE